MIHVELEKTHMTTTLTPNEGTTALSIEQSSSRKREEEEEEEITSLEKYQDIRCMQGCSECPIDDHIHRTR